MLLSQPSAGGEYRKRHSLFYRSIESDIENVCDCKDILNFYWQRLHACIEKCWQIKAYEVLYINKYINRWCGDKNGCAFTESRDAENRQNADY